MSEKIILIVEDDQFLGELTQKKFELEGFKVISARDGDEVFSVLEKSRPNLILLDIMLPGIDGYEVLRRLKISNSYKTIPVIIYSNLGQQDQIDRRLENRSETKHQQTEQRNIVGDGDQRRADALP